MAEHPLLNELRALSAGIGFLTRLPPPLQSTQESWRGDLARAPRYFPLIGAGIGALTGLVFWGLCFVLPPLLAAALALALEALITGAFHEDAFADFCDAFGGGHTSERVRDILKDSRIGAYGALGLGLGVLIRWTALTALAPGFAITACVAAGALARMGAVSAMRALAPAPNRESLAKDIGAQPSWTATAFALILCALCITPAVWASPTNTALAVALSLAPFAIITAMMRKKLGGSVGDGLGAIAFAVQALALTAFAARL